MRRQCKSEVYAGAYLLHGMIGGHPPTEYNSGHGRFIELT